MCKEVQGLPMAFSMDQLKKIAEPANLARIIKETAQKAAGSRVITFFVKFISFSRPRSAQKEVDCEKCQSLGADEV